MLTSDELKELDILLNTEIAKGYDGLTECQRLRIDTLLSRHYSM